jgi:hypothetical protein
LGSRSAVGQARRQGGKETRRRGDKGRGKVGASTIRSKCAHFVRKPLVGKGLVKCSASMCCGVSLLRVT